MCQAILDALCQYQSIRFITVRNKKLVAIYYFIQFLVLCYVVGYTIIADKGYQSEDDVNGSTSVKIKGSGAIGNGSSLQPLDSMDLVVPSNELDAFFLTTAITTTRNQTQTTCNGDEDAPLCTRADTSNCTEIYFSPNAQGIFPYHQTAHKLYLTNTYHQRHLYWRMWVKWPLRALHLVSC